MKTNQLRAIDLHDVAEEVFHAFQVQRTAFPEHKRGGIVIALVLNVGEDSDGSQGYGHLSWQ